MRREVAADAVIDPTAAIDTDILVVGPGARIGSGAQITGRSVTIGSGCEVSDGCRVEAPEVELGQHCVLFPRVTILALVSARIGDHGKFSRDTVVKAHRIHIGQEFWMNRDAEIGGGGWRNDNGVFLVGDRCHVGRRAHINTADLVSFGDDTAVGMDCTLATHAHWQPVTLGYQRRRGPISLGSDVALYTRSIISPGVTIGAGSTVAAGAVVLTDVPPGVLVAGVPAHVVRAWKPPDSVADIIREALAAFTACAHANPNGRVQLRERDGSVSIEVHASDGTTCVFDIDTRVVSGASSPLSEALRNHLFGYGLRFRYDRYRRHPVSAAALVTAGIEEW